jgi:hypothetical protein
VLPCPAAKTKANCPAASAAHHHRRLVCYGGKNQISNPGHLLSTQLNGRILTLVDEMASYPLSQLIIDRFRAQPRTAFRHRRRVSWQALVFVFFGINIVRWIVCVRRISPTHQRAIIAVVVEFFSLLPGYRYHFQGRSSSRLIDLCCHEPRDPNSVEFQS